MIDQINSYRLKFVPVNTVDISRSSTTHLSEMITEKYGPNEKAK